MTHLPQMPAAAAAFSQPEFSLGNAAQVLHVRTLEFLGKRFPSGVVGVWEHADVEGEVFGFKTDHKVITLRLGPELYLVIPFVQCQRGDLATAVRLQTFFNGVTRETPQVLIVAVMMTQEEVQMAKELHFEVISLLTDLPQDGTGAAPTTGNNNATQTTTRTSRRQSVMWDSVFEVSAPPPNSKALPEVKSWDDFFKLLKLTPEKAKEYADCFTNEALELEQLADLDRKMLKEFGLPIGVQVRILRLAARLQERTELRAADKKAAAPAAAAPAPVPTPAAALLTPTNSLDGSERRGGTPPSTRLVVCVSDPAAASPTPFSAPVSVPVPVVASPAPAATAGPGSPAPVHPSVYLPLSTSPARAPASPLRPAIKVSALPPPPTVPTQHLRISSVLLPPPPPPLQFEGLPMPMALPPPPPPQSPHSPAP